MKMKKTRSSSSRRPTRKPSTSRAKSSTAKKTRSGNSGRLTSSTGTGASKSSAQSKSSGATRDVAGAGKTKESQSTTSNSSPSEFKSGPDSVSLSQQDKGPEASFVNPLDNMFSSSGSSNAPSGSSPASGNASGSLEPTSVSKNAKPEPTSTSESSETSTASAHADGDLKKGTFDVGAEASSGSSKTSTSSDGSTEKKKSETREAHARIGASADLSEGRLSNEFDVGASLETHESGVSRSQHQLGEGQLRLETGGQIDVQAEAGIRSRTEVDLSQGNLDYENRAAVGANASAGGHLATEFEANGVTRRDELAASVSAGAHASTESRARLDENGINLATSSQAGASVMAETTATTGYSSEAGSLQGQVRGEASVGAHAYASSHFTSTADELSFSSRAGAGAAAQLAIDASFQGETANGSSFHSNIGANTGSVGAGAGYEFSRTPGQTSFGFESSGDAAIIGGQLSAGVTIADRDIAETAAAPLHTGASVYNAVGDGAQRAGEFTESTRQAAHGRQDFIQQMGEVSTGNLIADTGIAAAETVHGAYTATADFADNFADGAAVAYRDAGENLSNTASSVADSVERGVGNVMDAGVRTVHSGYQTARTGYQYGSAIAGGFVQGLGQGARNIGSFLNPFD